MTQRKENLLMKTLIKLNVITQGDVWRSGPGNGPGKRNPQFTWRGKAHGQLDDPWL